MSEIESKPGRGGKRPGAGRPKGSTQGKHSAIEQDYTMLELLRQIALGRVQVDAMQLKSAIAAVAYEEPKPGEIGKKAGQQAAAEEVAQAFPVTPTPLRAIK